jgi:hypothetical protein
MPASYDHVAVHVSRHQSTPIDLLVAIAVPLAMLALAYALWAISDRLLQIGPFDRAAFGWIFVAPLLWLAPGVAGFAWAPMPPKRQWIAAILVGATVALVSAVLLANAIDYANCAPVTSWTDNLPRSLAVGIVVGAGPALGAVVVASVANRLTGLRRIVAAVATGAIIGFAVFFAAILTFAALFPLISCAAPAQ